MTMFSHSGPLRHRIRKYGVSQYNSPRGQHRFLHRSVYWLTRGQHRSGMESHVVYNCLVFFSHHTICQCTVQKSAVKVFVKHVINGVAKKLTSAKLRNCNEYYSLYITSSFSVDLNLGVCRDKATITGKLSTWSFYVPPLSAPFCRYD